MAELSNDVKVIAQVITERKRQDMQWGGPAHDDTHDWCDWYSYIDHQLCDRYLNGPKEQHRDALVKIAALAVAAIESMDRKGDRDGQVQAGRQS